MLNAERETEENLDLDETIVAEEEIPMIIERILAKVNEILTPYAGEIAGNDVKVEHKDDVFAAWVTCPICDGPEPKKIKIQFSPHDFTVPIISKFTRHLSTRHPRNTTRK